MNELSTLISLAICVFVIFVLYNRYRLDHYRQDLFAIRDELFDEARAGHISFESPAYRATRVLMNGLLRFGHELSLLNFFLTRVMVGKQHLAASGQQFEQEFAGVPEADAELCKRYLDRMHRRTIQHMFKSPAAWVTLVVPTTAYVAAAIGKDLAMATARKLRAQLAELDARAFERGSDNKDKGLGSRSFC